MGSDVVTLRGGTIYDGSGGEPMTGDLVIGGDAISAVGGAAVDRDARTIDVEGLAVAPGFINMMSWSCETLITDGRSQSEIRQGVTLEVMGEGFSMGPLTDPMKHELSERGILNYGPVDYPVEWTTIGEYLTWLERRGVSTNVASFVGAGTVRRHEVGLDDRAATPEELQRMCDLVREAMAEGALGVASALIYPPSAYASTDELVAPASAASESGGMYASHMRSEGGELLEAIGELIEIARRANITAEIYHLKAAGRANWHKLDAAIGMIEDARAEGLAITADMYPYHYAGTGLESCIPPWAHDGGFEALIARLKDRDTRERIRKAMLTPSTEWENMFDEVGPDGIVPTGFRSEGLARFRGKTLTEIAAERGTSPDETLLDLVIEDDSAIATMYFAMSEDNVRREIQLPWMSFCSDAESQAPEGSFLDVNPHPRAYGAFARVLGMFVRDEGLITLQEAIRRMTSLPADNLKLERRGRLLPGHLADVVVFDPARIQDHATPSEPHRYATGMVHVFVNGEQVLADGEHTGATPGRAVRGPGARVG